MEEGALATSISTGRLASTVPTDVAGRMVYTTSSRSGSVRPTAALPALSSDPTATYTADTSALVGEVRVDPSSKTTSMSPVETVSPASTRTSVTAPGSAADTARYPLSMRIPGVARVLVMRP